MSDIDDDASDEEEDPNAKKDTKRQSEAELKAKNNEPEGNAINDRREEDVVSDQEEHRHRRGEIEEREGENLRGEHSAATSTTQGLNPDYIVELSDICVDRVGEGGEDECKATALLGVSEALDSRDEKTIRLAKRWSDAGNSPGKVVNMLVNVRMARMAENKRKG